MVCVGFLLNLSCGRQSRSPTFRRLCSSAGLSHVGPDSRPTMVDISNKKETVRSAHARCYLLVPNILKQVFDESADASAEYFNKKGPIFSTSILAGIQGAKKTSELIPLCHHVALDDCNISIEYDARHARLQVDCVTRTSSKTGVEMEALVGLSSAALCIYDMCKGLSHDIVITEMKLMSKIGGKKDFSRLEIK